MSGVDKSRLERKLVDLGWTVTVTDKLIPPASLFKDAPYSLSLYEAATIQDILGEVVK